MHGRRSTRRLFTALAAATVIAAAFTFASATASASDATSHLSGGGTASFSQVAFNVTINGSAASGSFECLMAGRSAFILPPGLAHNMIVHATPTAASVVGSVVTFTGPGRLTMDGTQKMDIHVSVTVDVAAQSFELTVVEVGPMGIEYMRSGKLTLR
jgi:hypothetical protein